MSESGAQSTKQNPLQYVSETLAELRSQGNGAEIARARRRAEAGVHV